MNEANAIPHAIGTLKAAMVSDPEYAWAWHCNLAVQIMDAANASPAKANEAAALIMRQMFDCDITTHPQYRFSKSPVQEYFEARVAAEREGDAAKAAGGAR